jgi:hypothetical protein
MINTSNIIILVTIGIILAVFIIVLYLVYKNPVTTNVTNTSSGATINGVGLICAAGQCSVSLTNGSKTCPDLKVQQLIIDPTASACSNEFSCDDPRFPYAVNSDGSTNLTGTCETGVICRCSNQLSCPNQLTSTFNITNGSPYQNFFGQRITITQDLITKTISPSGVPSDINVYNPVALSDPTTSTCTISPDYLSYLAPGTCSTFNVSTAAGISQCTIANPCIAGSLAYILPTTTNVNNFTSSQATTTPLGCVYGGLCQTANTLPVWDNTNNVVRCIPI